jgi:hypothetical protein
VLDFRTYKLVPGGGEEFGRILRERALPMLKRSTVVIEHTPTICEALGPAI